MEKAKRLNYRLKDAKDYGWEVPDGIGHKWETMVGNVQAHVKSLNFGCVHGRPPHARSLARTRAGHGITALSMG